MATITSPLTRTTYLIARSAHFRVWCGITTGTENEKMIAALARIHVMSVNLDDVTLPCAVVTWGEGRGAERVGVGGGAFIETQPVATKFFENFTATPDDPGTPVHTHDATVKTIIDDMRELSGASDHISFDELIYSGHMIWGNDAGDEIIETEWTWTGPQWGSQDE